MFHFHGCFRERDLDEPFLLPSAVRRCVNADGGEALGVRRSFVAVVQRRSPRLFLKEGPLHRRFIFQKER